jgi:ribonuclease J
MKKEHINGVTRVARQKIDKIEQVLKPYRPLMANPPMADPTKIRITPLGGQDGIGEKNMIVVEYGDDAVILDCGFELGIDLPGINYAIPVTDYLHTIKHKIRGYVISHGHMDHIGGLVHIVPQFPAPIYGSQFTIGMVEAQFNKKHEATFQPDTRVIDMDKHERVTLGSLTIELVRVTHAIPESSAIVVDTPIGRLINTGDFRLDPEPLDAKPSDIARLKELGDEGVLLLMSESTNTTKLGRTPTEHTLQDSFYELVGKTNGRLIVAVFSTNMNRVQMIINAAHHYGRKVALDGSSMMVVAELAVRLGNLKIPKGVLIPMREANSIPDKDLVIICTGGQGEPGAALSRMASGEHRSITLKKGDSVVISSTPIPGNEQRYAQIGDYLARMNVTQYRHPTHEIDGSGPLHVSGHGSRDEHKEMLELTRPKFLMPIYGGALPRHYHKTIGLAAGLAEQNIIMVENGAFTEFNERTITTSGAVVTGSLLVDQTGSIVPEIVTKDRLLLMDDGFIVTVLTIDKNGRLLTSPDILTRGHVAVKENAELLAGLRAVIKKTIAKRTKLTSRTAIDLLKNELRIAAVDYIYAHTMLTPIVIPVVNVIGPRGKTNQLPRPVADVH